MHQTKLESCIQILNKLPINKLEQSINAVSNLIYDDDDLLNEFLQKIEHPLKVSFNDGGFITCEYNRDGDSYRSPLSNKYFPSISDGRVPLPELRQLEVKLNKMFTTYVQTYYSSSTMCSVYAFELNQKIDDGFAVVVLIRNVVGNEKKLNSGVWETTNFITVRYSSGTTHKYNVEYNLTATIQLQMGIEHKYIGSIGLSGSVTRQQKETFSTNLLMDEQFHVENIGNMVEDMEISLREHVQSIYINKTRQIIDTIKFSPVEGKQNIEQSNKLREVMMNK